MNDEQVEIRRGPELAPSVTAERDESDAGRRRSRCGGQRVGEGAAKDVVHECGVGTQHLVHGRTTGDEPADRLERIGEGAFHLFAHRLSVTDAPTGKENSPAVSAGESQYHTRTWLYLPP